LPQAVAPRQIVADAGVAQPDPRECSWIRSILFRRLAGLKLAGAPGLGQHFAEPALGSELQLGGVGDHAAMLRARNKQVAQQQQQPQPKKVE
jgi:hypothetical protein